MLLEASVKTDLIELIMSHVIWCNKLWFKVVLAHRGLKSLIRRKTTWFTIATSGKKNLDSLTSPHWRWKISWPCTPKIQIFKGKKVKLQQQQKRDGVAENYWHLCMNISWREIKNKSLFECFVWFTKCHPKGVLRISVKHFDDMSRLKSNVYDTWRVTLKTCLPI